MTRIKDNSCGRVRVAGVRSAKARHSHAGFTVLFAVLVGALLFSLGLAIAHLSKKEIILSTAGRQSEIAFFAADTGIECALYFDRRVVNTFPNSSSALHGNTINCNGNPITLNFPPLAPDAQPREPLPSWTVSAATTTFRATLVSGCADVVVGKTTAPFRTVIEARGRSDCGSNFNPARVERALRVRY